MVDFHFVTETNHDGMPWETVNVLGPHVLWFLFAVGLLWWIGRSSLQGLLAQIQKVSVGGIEFEFKRTLQMALEAQGKSASVADVDQAARRLAHSKILLAGAKLLWIDDHPENNRFERALLEEAGAYVQNAFSSEQAWRLLKMDTYDLVLSDIRRGDDANAGITFLKTFATEGPDTPFIFYVGEGLNATLKDAFGITSSPDELIHLILDALARRHS